MSCTACPFSGSFQRSRESLGDKNHGLPHFLYNCSKQCLYGVFEVSVQMRELRHPLGDDHFCFVPFDDNVATFRSELSQSEVEDLLRIFGISCKRTEKSEDDNDGEWEKVKSKNKTKRRAQSDLSKSCISPHRSNGRRRGTPCSNGRYRVECAPVSHGRSSFQFGIGRGRNYESRADVAENWRSAPLYRNHACSTKISSLSLPSCENVQLDKGQQQIGDNREIPSVKCADGDPQRDHETSTITRSPNIDKQAEYEDLIPTDSSSVDCNGDAESMPKLSIKSSFESYSAALKSGIYDNIGDACIAFAHITPNNGSNFTGSNGGAISTDTCSSPGSITGFPRSPSFGLCWGEISADPSQFQTELIQKHVYSSDDNCNLLSCCHTPDERDKQQHLVAIFNDGDDLRESVKIELYDKKQNNNALSFGSPPGSAGGHNRQKMIAKTESEMCSLPKKVEESRFTVGIPKRGHLQDSEPFGTKDNDSTPNAWKNGSLSTSERFHDPDPAVNSANSSIGSPSEQRHSVRNHERAVPYQLCPSQTLHEKFDGVRLLESKQRSTSVPSQTRINKPCTPKAFQQAKRLQESHRQLSEELEFNQHKHQLQITRPRLHNEYKENNVPTWYFGQNHVHQGPIPVCYPGSSSHLVHEQPLSTTLSNLGYEDRGYKTNTSNASHVGDFSVNHSSSRIAPEIQSPAQQVHLSTRSPILLFLPVFSPVVGTLPSVLPLPPPVKSGCTYIESLHTDILEFAKMVRPTVGARARVEAALECVRDAVKQLWPGADMEVFGSFSTGLCLAHSDVDVAVDLPRSFVNTNFLTSSRPHAAAHLIRELAACLHQYSWCESLATIETAAMPVIKLQCRPFITDSESTKATTSPIAIDITIGGRIHEVTKISHAKSEMSNAAPRVAHNGAAAREYVIGKLRQLPALAPLVLVMKSYLHHRHLNDVYSGGLGSFSLTLLLVFYLERVSSSYGLADKVPPFCPSKVPAFAEASSTFDSIEALDDENEFSCTHSTSSSVSVSASNEGLSILKVREILERADQVVTEVLDSMEFSVTPNLGTLLLGFLHTFGHSINLSRVRLVLKGTEDSSCGIIPHEHTTRPAALCIEDPLNPGAIVGAGSFNMWHVQAAMRHMLYVLTKPNSITNLPSKQDITLNRRLLDELFVSERETHGASSIDMT
ncbi:hypothetical protein O6H91_02G081300 [Diphasiastrum complanatum]|uniref:Uncharacterized protein n=1 Tax=Diphasiastrum complanatum TaxID=34168 RepID=A0ACC2EHU4_DIPCM|nr:hypothetical protein O6H91_02G081300 [Diphasiastrum complanatum]